jgi:hypothetical protein
MGRQNGVRYGNVFAAFFALGERKGRFMPVLWEESTPAPRR